MQAFSVLTHSPIQQGHSRAIKSPSHNSSALQQTPFNSEHEGLTLLGSVTQEQEVLSQKLPSGHEVSVQQLIKLLVKPTVRMIKPVITAIALSINL